ncbi:hydroxypyruvate isomerase family protein [Rhizobium sp. KVB221]|uniref:Hydroxypyruvate isomerase family protein n=1 Tax=Rhizobium setariae TaxID=2801340 RepID=A0A937CQA4_9HYPH|nr:2-oxo-tetronate isomerase [Rhizobium setariae]MBL0373613.1 hydroxypyruvate isomerase family protein [Rhizobium setariae]
MPRFAANLTMMFNEVPFSQRFKAAADAGFGAVEFLFPYDHPAESVAEWLQVAGVRPALFNMPPGDWAAGDRGYAALPGRQEDFRHTVNKAIDYARIIGTPFLHMMAGIADGTDAAAKRTYRDSLKFAADATAEIGVGLVIEPLNKRDMPGYFLDDFDRAADIIAELDHPNLKLQFDIYHRQIMHGDVLKGLEKMMPIIGHIQTASVPKRNEPGTGELNDARIFQVLDELGYGGYVGCEYRPTGDTVAGLGWMQAI